MEHTGTTVNFCSITVYLHMIDNTQAHSKDHVDHTKYDGQLHFVRVKEDNLVRSYLQHDINMLVETTPSSHSNIASHNNKLHGTILGTIQTFLHSQPYTAQNIGEWGTCLWHRQNCNFGFVHCIINARCVLVDCICICDDWHELCCCCVCHHSHCSSSSSSSSSSNM